MYEMQMCVMGDDVITIANKEIMLRLTASHADWFKRLGFETKIHVMDNPFDAEFCSGRFYPSDKGLVFALKPGRFLAKTFYCTHALPPEKLGGWARAVAVGFAKDINHVPISRAIVRHVLNHTKGERLVHDDREIHRFHTVEAAEATRESFAMCDYLYGSGCVDVVEAMIRSCTQLTVTFAGMAVEEVIRVDCLNAPRKSCWMCLQSFASIAAFGQAVTAFVGTTFLIFGSMISVPLTILVRNTRFDTDPFWAFWYFGFLHPLLEESIKAYTPHWFNCSFLGLHALASYQQAGWRGAAQVAVLHGTWSLAHMFGLGHMALAWHMVWNTVVVYQEYASGRNAYGSVGAIGRVVADIYIRTVRHLWSSTKLAYQWAWGRVL